ncbi:ANTAR domain-containing protein [Nocardioides litoris]|uniref:ANTAR domain-containing protein n=1 Tax=Nocardioides litoris TaxID=1926648 RepID=UPI001476B756|nr:ANTAR domain-containing protein [Nocardioides litoris]
MSRPLDVVSALTRVLRDLQSPTDVDVRLRALVAAARDLAPLVDHAGLVAPGDDEDGQPVVRAGTGPLLERLVAAEHETGEGPVRAVLGGEPATRLDQLGGATRWPSYAAQADAAGLCSQLVVPVVVEEQVAAALVLCATDDSVLDERTPAIAELVAELVALVLGHDRRVENLDAALSTRTTIGLALGMVMQRLQIDQDTAFAYLTRLSATSETKLRDVAAGIVQQHGETARRDGSGPTPGA